MMLSMDSFSVLKMIFVVSCRLYAGMMVQGSLPVSAILAGPVMA